MAHAGRIVALGLTLLVGGLSGYLIAQPQKPVTVTTTATAESARTVEVTIQADPVTVTVEPQPTDDPTGPKANGNYLVGSELAPGTWQCSEAGGFTTWFTRNKAGDPTEAGSGTLAVIPDQAYIADLNECAGTWSLVG